jgi:hypothetical protein
MDLWNSKGQLLAPILVLNQKIKSRRFWKLKRTKIVSKSGNWKFNTKRSAVFAETKGGKIACSWNQIVWVVYFFLIVTDRMKPNKLCELTFLVVLRFTGVWVKIRMCVRRSNSYKKKSNRRERHQTLEVNHPVQTWNWWVPSFFLVLISLSIM